ncbi:MAG TPA: primosomal replication protein N [Nitrosospira sp.]|nr:primosomal replication protein N [Nitrosospira sp.]
MGCNDVAICGQIVETSALRYTPAGVPVAEFKITHASRQIEAGRSRQVECEISAVALGQMAEAVSRVETGMLLKLTGFLAKKSRMNPQLILHVNGIDFI